MLTKSDLSAIEGIITKKTKGFATRKDLGNFATKRDLEGLATKKDLESLASKRDLEGLATKKDLRRLENKLDVTIRVFDNEYITLRKRVDKLEVASTA